MLDSAGRYFRTDDRISLYGIANLTKGIAGHFPALATERRWTPTWGLNRYEQLAIRPQTGAQRLEERVEKALLKKTDSQ